MILFEQQGNILNSSLHTLVCPVNTVGRMGKGLALQFKLAYPGLEWMYQRACTQGLFHGSGFVVWNGDAAHKVVCMATKQHWRYPSKMEWVDQALTNLAEHYETHGIRSLAIPAVGCGEGKLPWDEVRGLIYSIFEEHPLPVGIYAPT